MSGMYLSMLMSAYDKFKVNNKQNGRNIGAFPLNL